MFSHLSALIVFSTSMRSFLPTFSPLLLASSLAVTAQFTFCSVVEPVYFPSLAGGASSGLMRVSPSIILPYPWPPVPIWCSLLNSATSFLLFFSHCSFASQVSPYQPLSLRLSLSTRVCFSCISLHRPLFLTRLSWLLRLSPIRQIVLNHSAEREQSCQCPNVCTHLSWGSSYLPVRLYCHF